MNLSIINKLPTEIQTQANEMYDKENLAILLTLASNELKLETLSKLLDTSEKTLEKKLHKLSIKGLINKINYNSVGIRYRISITGWGYLSPLMPCENDWSKLYTELYMQEYSTQDKKP